MTVWVVIVAVGVGSFLFRLGPLLVFQRVSLSDRTDRLIRHAGTAAITALIVLSTRTSATGGATVPALLAVAAGVVLASRGASMVRLVAFGGGIYAGALAVVALVAR